MVKPKKVKTHGMANREYSTELVINIDGETYAGLRTPVPCPEEIFWTEKQSEKFKEVCPRCMDLEELNHKLEDLYWEEHGDDGSVTLEYNLLLETDPDPFCKGCCEDGPKDWMCGTESKAFIISDDGTVNPELPKIENPEGGEDCIVFVQGKGVDNNVLWLVSVHKVSPLGEIGEGKVLLSPVTGKWETNLSLSHGKIPEWFQGMGFFEVGAFPAWYP